MKYHMLIFVAAAGISSARPVAAVPASSRAPAIALPSLPTVPTVAAAVTPPELREIQSLKSFRSEPAPAVANPASGLPNNVARPALIDAVSRHTILSLQGLFSNGGISSDQLQSPSFLENTLQQTLGGVLDRLGLAGALGPTSSGPGEHVRIASIHPLSSLTKKASHTLAQLAKIGKVGVNDLFGASDFLTHTVSGVLNNVVAELEGTLHIQ